MSDYQLHPRRGCTYENENFMQPDIMFKIFVKLPIEAVVTCKCVCKTWRGIIEDPYFIEQQRRVSLHRAPRALIQHHRNRIAPGFETSPPDEKRLYLVDCDTRKARPLNVLPSLSMPGKDLDVMSTCDGLLCIASEYTQAPVYIYNPMVDSVVTLPSNGLKKNLICHKLGIIFHKPSGSYKVVRGYIFTIKGLEQYKFEMIKIGEGAWTELTPPSLLKKFNFGNPIEWHGAIHWLIQSARVTLQRIMSFDIEKETFQIVCFKGNPPGRNRLKMFVLNDELVLLDWYKSFLKIWKVEGDVVGGFYINQCTLMQTYVRWGGCYECSWMAETETEGTYILESTYRTTNCVFVSNLVHFSPETGCYTQLNLSGMPDHFATFSFKPTLVHPVRTRLNAL